MALPGAGNLGGMAGGLGGLGGLSYSSLSSKYNDFSFPQAGIELGGTPFVDKKDALLIDNINIELTSGFEAAVARFRIYNVFKKESGEFRFSDIKKQVLLGNSLVIRLGYIEKLEPVFTGFVAGVEFGFDPSDLPYVEVTGMDVKGIMMSGSYAMQLSATSYGDAVREILQRTAYSNLQSGQGITSIQVTDTPDKQQGGQQGESAETIEMVSESDYEFVVKAAKKFNFEFFTDCGKVYFRKAKSDTTPLIDIGLNKGLLSFRIGYSLTGIVETVEARSMDAGAGTLISAKKKFTNDISTGSKAKKLIAKSRHVYIDPSITTQQQADARVDSLLENMSYRLGSLECETPGMPELVPGRFIRITGLGAPVDNTFYITSVIHDFSSDTGYKTRLTGCASEVKKPAI